jgi:hypothetical protein
MHHTSVSLAFLNPRCRWGHYSYVQLIGFSLLIGGTLIYNSVVKIPFLYYPTKEDRH